MVREERNTVATEPIESRWRWRWNRYGCIDEKEEDEARTIDSICRRSKYNYSKTKNVSFHLYFK